MNNLSSFKKSLRKYVSKERAESNARFFKTGKGQYGEGDVFLGITVPNIRKVLKEFSGKLELEDGVELLQSKYHEERLAGVILLVSLYKTGDDKTKEIIFKTYLKNTERINNWDLVDVSASHIVGDYLLQGLALQNANCKARPCKRGQISLRPSREIVISKLAKSKLLWERRVAIVSTFAFIKNKECDDTIKICEILMNDREDLIHKACGWALREVGENCGQNILNKFLDKHASVMPRTMLRYALEKHNEKERKKYLVKSKVKILSQNFKTFNIHF